MPNTSAEVGIRYLLGVWALGTLATLFWCIVLTPVILVIGFAGKFWPVWNAVAAHPAWACLTTVALHRDVNALEMAIGSRES